MPSERVTLEQNPLHALVVCPDTTSGLLEVERADRRLEAYDHARTVTSDIYHEGSAGKVAALVSYLRNAANRWRAETLSAIADEELEVGDEDLLSAVSDLLEDSDREIRRSAALALYYGGPKAKAALSAYLAAAHSDDLNRLIELVERPRRVPAAEGAAR